MVGKDEALTVKKQCELLNVNRSSFYYAATEPSAEEMALEEQIKKRLDYWHTRYYWMGSRKLVLRFRVNIAMKQREQVYGYCILEAYYFGIAILVDKLRSDDGIEGDGRQLVRRYMQMGICAVHPKPNLSRPGKKHKKFPYLLRKMNIWLLN